MYRISVEEKGTALFPLLPVSIGWKKLAILFKTYVLYYYVHLLLYGIISKLYDIFRKQLFCYRLHPTNFENDSKTHSILAPPPREEVRAELPLSGNPQARGSLAPHPSTVDAAGFDSRFDGGLYRGLFVEAGGGLRLVEGVTDLVESEP